MLQIAYDPHSVLENVGLGVMSLRVQRDLERFKEFIETRGRKTGAWRGPGLTFCTHTLQDVRPESVKNNVARGGNVRVIE